MECDGLVAGPSPLQLAGVWGGVMHARAPSFVLVVRETSLRPCAARGCVPEPGAPFPGLELRCAAGGRSPRTESKGHILSVSAVYSIPTAPAEPELGIITISRDGDVLGRGWRDKTGVNLWNLGVSH